MRAGQEAARLYRYIRKHPMMQVYTKDAFKSLLAVLPKSEDDRTETLKLSLLHLSTRDEYATLMKNYNIGVKRDEKKQIEMVARHCGLEITRNEMDN